MFRRTRGAAALVLDDNGDATMDLTDDIDAGMNHFDIPANSDDLNDNNDGP